MKILTEISDKTLGLSEQETLFQKYELRKSARGILFREDGLISVQYLTERGYHKLPGGGVEVGESITDAFRREILEEVGCESHITQDVGAVIEYRAKEPLLHISYCFIANVVGPIGEPSFEPGEIASGHTAVWMTPEEALAQISGAQPESYNGKFIVAREKAFLEEALKKI